MADVLFFNGRFTTTDERVVGVEDRGFQFGDGVYEVFKFLTGRPIFLTEHYRRLERGLQELEIPNPWDEATFRETMDELLRRTSFDEGIVYIQLTRGEAERSHVWPERIAPTTVAYSRAFRFPDAAKKQNGIRVVTRADRRWRFCNLKSVNLLGNAIAKKEASRAGVDEAILVSDGFVREGATSSFFVVRNGALITHPLDEHVLPGVTRDRVIDLALDQKIRVDERPLREIELFDVEEAFITSTTQGVMPVTEIDGRIVGNARRGEITAVLQQRLDALEREELRAATSPRGAGSRAH